MLRSNGVPIWYDDCKTVTIIMRSIRIFVVLSLVLPISSAQILTHPLPSPQEVADLEARVQVNPDDLDSRRALLQYCLLYTSDAADE